MFKGNHYKRAIPATTARAAAPKLTPLEAAPPKLGTSELAALLALAAASVGDAGLIAPEAEPAFAAPPYEPPVEAEALTALGPEVAPPPAAALATKASMVFSALGLIEKTIPALQWGPWLQKNHIGAVSILS